MFSFHCRQAEQTKVLNAFVCISCVHKSASLSAVREVGSQQKCSLANYEQHFPSPPSLQPVVCEIEEFGLCWNWMESVRQFLYQSHVQDQEDIPQKASLFNGPALFFELRLPFLSISMAILSSQSLQHHFPRPQTMAVFDRFLQCEGNEEQSHLNAVSLSR